MRFTVWAPRASDVVLHLDGREIPAEGDPDGWWRAEAEAGHGSRYGWRLDGGDPRPDPRSRWQPDGVHGLSAVDAEDFAWTDQRWRGFHLPGAVVYELHVGTFSPEGTFAGVVERLPHLVELGIDAIELLPVAAFPGDRGWGYDGVLPYAVHDAYGGPSGLRRLVDAAHAAGIGVILDVVHNHLGPDGNHLGVYGPYFSDRHHTNWGDAVNLDGVGSDEVRRYFVDHLTSWQQELHLDGFRLDAVHALIDDSAVHFLEQLADEVAATAAHVGRRCWLIAESDRNDPRYVRPKQLGGYGLDSAWADEWHHALHAVLTGETDGYYEDFGALDQLVRALQQAWVHAGDWSPHRQRHHGRSPEGLAGHRFVVSVQNHDQVGNRATGDRIGDTISEGRLRIAAALLLTSPFVPMLFQGEEWSASTPFRYFTDHRDPGLGVAVSRGRTQEFAHFGWDPADVPDPQDPATFTSSVLRWDEIDRPGHAELLCWHRDLITLRRRHPELTDGRWTVQEIDRDPEARWIRIRRGEVVVVVNLGAAPTTVPVPDGAAFAEVEGRSLAHGARIDAGVVVLDPDGVTLLILAAAAEHRRSAAAARIRSGG